MKKSCNDAKVLILCTRNWRSDPRVVRQYRALSPQFSVKVLDSSIKEENSKYLLREGLPWRLRQLKLVMYGVFGNGRYKYLVNPEAEQLDPVLDSCRPSVILCNDLELLGIALGHKKKYGTKVILDAHEYYPAQTKSFYQRVIYGNNAHKICKRIEAEVDHMITVCDGIADLYVKNYAATQVSVIRNCSAYSEKSQTGGDCSVGGGGKPIRFVHHGGASPRRGLEKMIEVFGILGSEYRLDLVFADSGTSYLETLRQKVGRLSNVSIKEPVAFSEIVPMLTKYDLGIYLLPQDVINHQYALPNKFFEFIQARLGIVISPSVEMGELVEAHGLGLVSCNSSIQSVVDCIRSITAEDILKFKRAANSAASVLNAEKEWSQLAGLVERQLKDKNEQGGKSTSIKT